MKLQPGSLLQFLLRYFNPGTRLEITLIQDIVKAHGGEKGGNKRG